MGVSQDTLSRVHSQQRVHDACGVGFVASTKAEASHQIIALGLQAIASVQHRGGVGADGKTGDGAGIKLGLDQDFFKTEYATISGNDAPAAPLAVGMFFLPMNDTVRREEIIKIINETIEDEFGYQGTQWRDVPVNDDVLGTDARASRPHIQQLIIPPQEDETTTEFERRLYVARRVIEQRILSKELAGKGADTFYVPSMSTHTIVYKGLSLATELGNTFPDLLDERMKSTYTAFHQRFSTNTTPVWERAHPYRFLAHNGEINSLQGNVNNISVLDHLIRKAYGEEAEIILPIIAPGGSDSANVDNVIEALSHAGYSLPEIKAFLVPPAFREAKDMPANERALYEYISAVSGPWDGPATLAMSDQQQLLLGGDRNGLRPVRYVIDDVNGIIVAGSEEGMITIDPAHISKRGNLEAGELLGINIKEGGIQYDAELKYQAVMGFEEKHNITQALQTLRKVTPALLLEGSDANLPAEAILERQALFGYTEEAINTFLTSMAKKGKEPLGSMSDDSQPAYLTRKIYRPLSHYFKQKFAQVTNPPIDPIREEHVTSLITTLGSFHLGESGAEQMPPVQVDSPVLTNNGLKEVISTIGDDNISYISTVYDVTAEGPALEKRLKEIQAEAEIAAIEGKHIVLTDQEANDGYAPIPMLLATSAAHTKLIAAGKRAEVSINVQTAECVDPHDLATLVGMGADTVNPYLAEATILSKHYDGDLSNITADKALGNYTKAMEAGLLKVMSKMGISDVSSYRGARLFSALGLSKNMLAEYFPGVPSALDGLTLTHLQERVENHHERASATNQIMAGGLNRLRKGQLPHAVDSRKIGLLQSALREEDTAKRKALYNRYTKLIETDSAQEPIYVHDLMGFNEDAVEAPIDIEETESADNILGRMMTGAMSMGSLSKEAHTTLARAMNRIGGKSNSGEGGEHKDRRWNPETTSKVKQVASGRFGVDIDYLSSAEEIQIKVAQGAKPGEGGQLMGEKVDVEIAELRNCEAGTTLISPPPHHDIYSIEDLAQLIYDMKEANSTAKVSVKLVAEEGVETIAVGVAKAGADSIHIAGGRGGTGASPQTSITHCGQEWEIALAKTHLALAENGFRERVKLTTDGGLRTGSDIVKAAILGGEEYGFGLQALIAEGCKLARVCQGEGNDKCPVGVATPDPERRLNFDPNAEEHVVRMFQLIADDVRETLASLGLKSLDQAIGRFDLIKQIAGQDLGVNFDEIMPVIPEKLASMHNQVTARSEYHNPANPGVISRDREWMKEYGEEIFTSQNLRIRDVVTNQDRNIGTGISGALARQFQGENTGNIQFVTLDISGIAGESLGAFLRTGVDINLVGAANDYVGKGLSGGTIRIRPEDGSRMAENPQDHTIIGNTCFYGAIDGDLYAAGKAGNRFGVRLSGARAVIEGAQDSACEYMTGGEAVILGEVGNNFGAGASGGEAYVYDPNLQGKSSKDTFAKVTTLEACSPEAERLKERIITHHGYTGSKQAERILKDWENAITNFRYVNFKTQAANDKRPAAAPALVNA